jgi:hypothetical protein
MNKTRSTFKKPIYCKYYLRDAVCPSGYKCKFVHNKPPKRQIVETQKLGTYNKGPHKQCRPQRCTYYFSKGCKYGDKCKYSHKDEFAFPFLIPVVRFFSQHSFNGSAPIWDETFLTRDGFTFYEDERMDAPVSLDMMKHKFRGCYGGEDRTITIEQVFKMIQMKKLQYYERRLLIFKTIRTLDLLPELNDIILKMYFEEDSKDAFMKKHKIVTFAHYFCGN